MNGFQVVEIGALDEWRVHSTVEELCVFLDGRGQMGLDDSFRLPEKPMPWVD
ncbi:hypothetical protein [Microbacterium sp. LWH13-1.2]|uniref:hypothetical protein n=1 Tax=Microbacterium sp. LWH13-1.2 TaxID=3135260 RepID=UPI00313949A4